MEDSLDCPICLDQISNETLVNTKCNHCFHQLCIDKWLSAKYNCPCCRSTIIDHDEEDDLPLLIDYVDLMINQSNNHSPLINQNSIFYYSQEPFIYSIGIFDFNMNYNEYSIISSINEDNNQDLIDSDDDDLPDLINNITHEIIVD